MFFILTNQGPQSQQVMGPAFYVMNSLNAQFPYFTWSILFREAFKADGLNITSSWIQSHSSEISYDNSDVFSRKFIEISDMG